MLSTKLRSLNNERKKIFDGAHDLKFMGQLAAALMTEEAAQLAAALALQLGSRTCRRTATRPHRKHTTKKSKPISKWLQESPVLNAAVPAKGRVAQGQDSARAEAGSAGATRAGRFPVASAS